MVYDKAYAKQWRDNNKDKMRKYRADYVASHQSKIKDYNAKWHADNREVHIEQCKKWNKTHPDRVFDLHLQRQYGITKSQYDTLFVEQDGKCAICGQQSSEKLQTDHNHITGEVRGLLCGTCNKVLGLVKDNQNTLHKMLEYLDKDQI